MLAVFGRAATPATVLHDGDRIELLRPLLADPKQRRRERAGGKGR
jgi:putative ubiquitin-RnfH superfamily antitoxin RatB of RatAB toxin-antitoxin module